MRTATTILLSAMFFLWGFDCHAQDPCSPRLVKTTESEKTLSGAEIAHQVLLKTTPTTRRFLVPGDVEFVLKCGTQQDAAELFADIRGAAMEIGSGTVVETDKSTIRVAWDDDGFKANLKAFLFNFDKPLTEMPHPGEKLIIRGTYSSFSREPFQINVTNSSYQYFDHAR